MATGLMSEVLQHLRSAVQTRDGEEMSDGQLLDRFLTCRDESAFATLMRRHAMMVWGVCRRVLTNTHDAEDAFQATFLVLVRKGSSVNPRERVASWLFGVARQTAMKARSLVAKRQVREKQVDTIPEPAATEVDVWNDLRPLLDQEMSHLPDKYRAVLLSCDLEGKTRKETARQLAIPEGTVAGWLARARTMLAQRLARHRVFLSSGALALVLARNAASASVPASIISTTMNAVSLLAGTTVPAGAISSPVTTLMQEVLKTMWMNKLKTVSSLIVLLGALLMGGGVLFGNVLADTPTKQKEATDEQPRKPREAKPDEKKPPDRQPRERGKNATTVSGPLEKVEAEKNTVTISVFSRADAMSTDKTFTLAKDVAIMKDGVPVKLADLKRGSRATLQLSEDMKTVIRVTVAGRTASGEFYDVGKKTITLVVEMRNMMKGKSTFTLSKDVKVMVNGKAATLQDLKEGARVSLTFAADEDSIIRIQMGDN